MNHMGQEIIDINKLPGVKKVIDLSKLEPFRIPFFLRLRPVVEVLEHFFRDGGDICISGRSVSFLPSVMLEHTLNLPETTKEQAKHSITSFLEKNSVAPSEAFLEVLSQLVEEVLYPFFENDLYKKPRLEPYRVYVYLDETRSTRSICSDFTFMLDGKDGKPAEVMIYIGSLPYYLYPNIGIEFGFSS